MRICPKCGFKDPSQIAAALRYDEKRKARRRAERKRRRRLTYRDPD